MFYFQRPAPGPSPLPPTMRHLLSFLLCALLLPACQQARKVGHSLSAGSSYLGRPVITGTQKLATATMAGTRKVASATVSGAKTLAAQATRLISFGSAKGPPAPAPLTPAAPKDTPGLPPAHKFPATGLLVTDSELGPDATRLQSTAVNLAGGWILNGTDLAYRLQPGADDPSALRVKGSPATATLTSENGTTTATARELHYHATNQILTLRGNPTLSSPGTTITASPQTLIKIHLPTGSISITGPARWSSD